MELGAERALAQGRRLSATAFYRLETNTAQGQRQANFNVDFAARRNVLGERGTLTLRVSDVFNTLRHDFTATGPGLRTDSRFKRESRLAFLGFTYRFGQHQATRPTRKSDANDDAGGGFE